MHCQQMEEMGHEQEMHCQQMEEMGHEQEMHHQWMEALINPLPAPGSPALGASVLGVPSFAPFDPMSEQKKGSLGQKGTKKSPLPFPKGMYPWCGKMDLSVKDCWFINSKC